MAAYEGEVAAIVAEQQKYAADHKLPAVFEGILLSIIYAKPASLLDHIGKHLTNVHATGVLEPSLPGREVDTEAAARAYLDEHRVHDALEELFTSVLFAKPADPLAHIGAECKRLAAIKGIAKGAARLYTEADLRALHKLYDPSGKGTITKAQAATAFRNLGLKTAPAGLPEHVDEGSFVAAGKAAIDAEK